MVLPKNCGQGGGRINSIVYRPGKTHKPVNNVCVNFSNLCTFLHFACDFLCKSQKKARTRKYIKFRLSKLFMFFWGLELLPHLKIGLEISIHRNLCQAGAWYYSSVKWRTSTADYVYHKCCSAWLDLICNLNGPSKVCVPQTHSNTMNN